MIVLAGLRADYSSLYDFFVTPRMHVKYNPFFRGFTITGAYRYTDAKTDYKNAEGQISRIKKPLVSDYKGLLTASYQTHLKKWQFDLTGQFNGGGRMPAPDKVNSSWNTNFKSYIVVNAQITKYFRRWSVYLGAENLFDYTQPNPIIGAADPRGGDLDGSMVWGPVHGQKIYAGLRFNISRD